MFSKTPTLIWLFASLESDTFPAWKAGTDGKIAENSRQMEHVQLLIGVTTLINRASVFHPSTAVGCGHPRISCDKYVEDTCLARVTNAGEADTGKGFYASETFVGKTVWVRLHRDYTDGLARDSTSRSNGAAWRLITHLTDLQMTWPSKSGVVIVPHAIAVKTRLDDQPYY